MRHGSSSSSLLKRRQDTTANQQYRQTGTMAGERRHHGPRTSILDTQAHSDEGQQTLRRLGSNVPWYESSSTEPRYYRLPQIHGRAYLDSLLQNSELPPSHVQQLSQHHRLDKTIHLKNSSRHAFSMDLPQHISPQQEQWVSPQEDVRQDSAQARVTGRDSSGSRPSRKQFFTGDQLQQSHQIPHQVTEILDPGGKHRIDSPAMTTSPRGLRQMNQRQDQLETTQSKKLGIVAVEQQIRLDLCHSIP
jgi:hypothetical protein